MDLSIIISECIVKYLKYILEKEIEIEKIRHKKLYGNEKYDLIFTNYLRIDDTKEFTNLTTIFSKNEMKNIQKLIRIWNDRKNFNHKDMAKWCYLKQNAFKRFKREIKNNNGISISSFQNYKRKYVTETILRNKLEK